MRHYRQLRRVYFIELSVHQTGIILSEENELEAAKDRD